jgi:hypothetical protein
MACPIHVHSTEADNALQMSLLRPEFTLAHRISREIM